MSAVASPNAGWIESPKYDLWLLALPPLFGIAICSFAWALDPAIVSGFSLFVLGMPHYLSTYSYYFDDKNAAYARKRAIAFYAGPVLIVFALAGAILLKLYMLVALIVDVWNVFHVSRQSSGILSVYRHLNAGDNRSEKVPANLALVLIGFGLYSVTIADQPDVMYYLRRLPFDVTLFLGPALLSAGLIALGFLVMRMRRRAMSFVTPETLFLTTSALLFLPYVLMKDRHNATSAMLAGHYVQYLGLLWLLNFRKYAEVTGSMKQRMLASISRSVPRILILLLSLVAVTGIVDRAIHHFNAMGLHNWLLNLVVLMHFYLDGLVWAFKHPHTRATIGPYLLLPDHRIGAPSAVPSMPLPAPAVG
jgi:uncharacterized membrane protein